MNTEKHAQIEAYMRSQMSDSAHDVRHVYRVQNYALDIARFEPEADLEVLTAAALLHDIGRAEQFADAAIDHAVAGAAKARAWLLSNGYEPEFADAVSAAISTHRYRSDNPPLGIEAKILFDADKIDVCGAMGIARTVQYKARTGEPLYSFNPDGTVSDGTDGGEPSLLHEYKFKLENIYDRFYTVRGAQLGESRRKAAADFYNSLLAEVRECYGASPADAYERPHTGEPPSRAITIKQVDSSYFARYAAIPMRVHVTSEYRLVRRDGGLGGISLVETPVEPYVKDFRESENVSHVPWREGWAGTWEISNWAFFMAFNGDKPVGAACVVTRTEGVNMLGGRDDLAVLWDIRVDDDYKRQGVGHGLFQAAAEWSKARGMTQLKIECQNNNVPAVKFYHGQGAVLAAIDEYAYRGDAQCGDEAQLILYLEL